MKTTRPPQTRPLSMPSSLWSFVDRMVADGEAGSPEDFLRGLVRLARRDELRERKELEAELQKGRDSGPLIRADESFWRERERRLIAKYGKTKPTRR